MRSHLPTEVTFELLDFVPLGAFALNSDLTVLFWNSCLEEWTNISREKIIGQRIDHHFPHLNQPKYLSRLDQIFEGGHPILFSSQLHSHLIPITRPDGQLQVQNTTVTAIPAVTSGEFYALWSIQDVTDLSNQVNRYKAEQAKARKSEAALRENEERWQLALHGNNDGIWDWNIKTQEVFFSPRWKEMLGFANHEIINDLTEWSKRVHPEDFAWVTQAIQDHFARKSPFYISEHRVQCKDGSYKWILDRGQAVWDDAGNPIRMVGSHTDITERKQTELALQESEAKYRNLIEHLNAGFVVHGADTHILQCNITACELLGLSMEQMLGKVAIDPAWCFLREDGTVMPPEEYPINRVLSTQCAIENYVVGVHRANHTQGWALVTAFPEFDPNNHIKQVIVTFIDISPLKQAETELRELAGVMENAISGISKLDAQGRYLYVNKAYADISGYQPEAMIGMQWHHTVHPNSMELLTTAYQQMRQDGKVEVEGQGIRQDGSSFYKQLVMIAAYNEQQHFIGHYCFMKDITEKARMEAERKAAEQALQESEVRFRTMADNAPVFIWVADIDGLCTFFNQSWLNFTGRTLDQEIGNGWTEGIHPDDLACCMDTYLTAFAARQSFQMDYRLRRLDGEYRWIVDCGTPRFTTSGEFVGFIGSCQDIHDRKVAEAVLQESESTLRSFFNNEAMLMGIVELHDHDILHLSDNQTTANFFGLTTDVMRNRFASDLGVPQEYLQQWIRAYHEAARTQAPAHLEYLHDTPTGQRWLAASVCQIASHSNEYPRFSYIVEDITERKQTEFALRESEARFQSFMNHSPAAAWITDGNGKILYLSQTYYRTFQVPPKDFIGQTIFELFGADIAQPLLENIQSVVQTQQALAAVEIAPRQDGTLGDFLVYKFPIPDPSGETLVGGVAIDVTQQHQTEAALRQSEATKQAIIQAIPDLLMRMCVDGSQVEFISDSEFNLVNPDDYPAKVNIHDVLPQHLAQLRLHHVQQTLQSQTTHVYEQELVVEGKQRYEEVRIAPLSQDQVLVMVRDVTARKQAEADLRHQKEMFQAIVDHIPIMIGLFNEQGVIQFINPELERVLGWSLADWQQRDILSDCYPDPLQRQIVLDHMLMATGIWRDFQTQDAQGRIIDTTWANVPLSNGHSLGIGQDISDRKRKEIALQQAMEAAEAANLAKSMFLANMSHELRTPLNVILGFAQVMGHDPSLTTSQKDDLRTIQRSGDHLLSLINDVLDLSKIEAGHCTLEENAFDLISLLHTLRTMMTERANSKRLQLTFDIAAEVPQFVIADDQKLRQILLNLLSNAIKFTKQGSVTLHVKIADADHRLWENMGGLGNPSLLYLQFDVTDTGVGIVAAELDIIFDAFVQAEAGKQSISGTGLGLTISRKLLELMNGTISVQSVPNVGSTFTVIVPVYPTSSVDTPPEQYDRTVIGLIPGHNHHRILIVDDQPENRLLMVRLLTRLGLEVQEARDGQEAIRIWQTWHPDLTWMDIRMPGLDGYEATKQIRAMEQEDLSVIIALTAQASHSDRTLALAAGCNDYISKPFREETVFLKMSEYLGLEYLYADPHTSVEPATIAPNPDHNIFSALDPMLLAILTPDWIQNLEDAAICGKDWAIVDLAQQLPPDLATLSNHLIELAETFQFDQIANWVHTMFGEGKNGRSDYASRK